MRQGFRRYAAGIFVVMPQSVSIRQRVRGVSSLCRSNLRRYAAVRGFRGLEASFRSVPINNSFAVLCAHNDDFATDYTGKNLESSGRYACVGCCAFDALRWTPWLTFVVMCRNNCNSDSLCV